jgi:DNA-binding response OmpR family regulator
MNTNPTTKPNPTGKLTRDVPSPVATTEAMKRKLLVVDDDRQIRESLRKLLRAEGYEVTLAATGKEGIEKFNAERFDLLLLDLNLPDHNGWDVFETLTSHNPFLPIIIITGRDKQYDLAAGAGVGALIEKPLNVPRLLQIIPELLAESAETRLKRLVGLHSDVRHLPPTQPASPDARSPKRRSNA